MLIMHSRLLFCIFGRSACLSALLCKLAVHLFQLFPVRVGAVCVAQTDIKLENVRFYFAVFGSLLRLAGGIRGVNAAAIFKLSVNKGAVKKTELFPAVLHMLPFLMPFRLFLSGGRLCEIKGYAGLAAKIVMLFIKLNAYLLQKTEYPCSRL